MQSPKFYKESFSTKDLLKNTSCESQLLTEESTFIVRKMLEANVPPVSSVPLELKNVPIGYKTGTSIGFKDSWSVGIFDRYVLCVWIGNFDGQGNNAFLGRRMAAPLFFENLSLFGLNHSLRVIFYLEKENYNLCRNLPSNSLYLL